jgi:rhodanese-related sulfurtransferase
MHHLIKLFARRSVAAAAAFMSLSALTLSLTLTLALALALAAPKPPYRVVTAPEANAILSFDTNVVVLDVRTQEEYDGTKGHLRRSRLIPVQELPTRWKELNGLQKKQVLVYCCQCPRSAEASSILARKGFTNVLKMDGGIDAWQEAKLPVELSANAPKDGSVTACSVPKSTTTKKSPAKTTTKKPQR